MRALLPEPADSPDLHEVYARDWIAAGGVRVNLVASVDGAAWVEGRTAGLQTPGDRAVFGVLRDLADVVLVGRGTAQAEGYEPVAPTRRRAEARARYGLGPDLPTAVVSPSLLVDLGAPLYAAGARTVIVTCERAGTARIVAARRTADVVVAGDETVDFPLVRQEFRTRGWTRILSEGGPTVFAALVAGAVVDEVCLTVAPRLAGPGAARIVAGAPWPGPVGLDLLSLLEEDGALFHRLRVRPQTAAG